MKKIIIALVLLFVPLLASASIDTNLYYGVQNKPQVQELQEFLIDQGFLTGNVTGNFYSLTLKAVKKYQTNVGINSTGYVGTLTRNSINGNLALQLQDSNQQAIIESPIINNQPIVQNQVPMPTGTNTQSVQSQPSMDITPKTQPSIDFQALAGPSDLIMSLKTKNTVCRLVAKDSDGNVVRDSNQWFLDKDQNRRQVISVDITKKYTYELMCDNGATETGDFPPFSQ